MSDPNNPRRFRFSIKHVFYRASGLPIKAAGIRHVHKRKILFGVLLITGVLAAIVAAAGQQTVLTFISNGTFFPNPSGASQTYNSNGRGMDLTGPFFQSMGTNGRS